MRNTESDTTIRPINVNFIGTPITDDTFERQGWVKIEARDEFIDDDEFDIEFTPDSDVFDDLEWDEETGEFPFDELEDLPFPYDMEPKYPNQGEWEEEYYFWILKVPKYWPDDDCMTLISTTSDHHLPGFNKGEYIIEIYNENGLGICQSEEQIEILYKSLTGESIYK